MHRLETAQNSLLLGPRPSLANCSRQAQTCGTRQMPRTNLANGSQKLSTPFPSQPRKRSGSTLRGASAKYNVSSIETPSAGPSALAEARSSASARKLSRLTTPTSWFALLHLGRVTLNAKTQRWRHKKQGTREGCLREFPLNLK